MQARMTPRIAAVAIGAALALVACQGAGEPIRPGGTPPPTTAAAATTATSSQPSTTYLPSTSSARSPTHALPTTTSPQATTPSPRPTATTSRPTSTNAACSIPAQLLGRDLTRLGTTSRVVALTFDGGSGNEAVGSILRTLAAEHVPGTFFLTGQFVDAFPSSTQAIADRYPVGNHTYHHPDLTTLSAQAIRVEVRTAAARIKTMTGKDPRPWFRFPFGAVDARTISVVNAECYVPFRWTVDTLGWKGTSGGQSSASVVARVVAGARPGEIVLMHVGGHPTDHSTLDADALPRVIAELRALGYSFVTLAAVIGPTP